MTFTEAYEKLLSDPEFGFIKKRREHAKQMYIAGMKEMRHMLGYSEEWFEEEINKIAEEK